MRNACTTLGGQQIGAWKALDFSLGAYPQLWCPHGQYSTRGQLFLRPLERSVRLLFSLQPPWAGRNALPIQIPGTGSLGGSAALDRATDTATGQVLSWVVEDDALAMYGVFVMMMMLITCGATMPVGMLIPSLAAGGAFGRLVGHGLQRLVHALGGRVHVCMPAWSVLGAAAMLAGLTRTTLSNVLILIESSNATPLAVPLVFVIVASKLVADALVPSIFQMQMRAASHTYSPRPHDMSVGKRAMLDQHKVRTPTAAAAAAAVVASVADADAAAEAPDTPLCGVGVWGGGVLR